jgi:hypothetical protein
MKEKELVPEGWLVSHGLPFKEYPICDIYCPRCIAKIKASGKPITAIMNRTLW